MHSKLKGNIGEAAAILALAKVGCNVFKEIGDLSRVDLIAELDGKFYTIQVKAITPVDNTLLVPTKKSGPNYQFRYRPNDCDFFVVCNLKDLSVAIVPFKEMVQNHSASFSLRLSPPKNGQKKNIRNFSDYTDILTILKNTQ